MRAPITMHKNLAKTPKNLLEELKVLYKGYSQEYRASTQPWKLEEFNRQGQFVDADYDPENHLLRESLLEHVGMLPVFATTTYAYLPKDEREGIDLGRALTMLAVHDIGELSVGDTITFAKAAAEPEDEAYAAHQLLDEMYHDVYDELKNLETRTAKFAKAVDKFTPDVVDLVTPVHISKIRYRHFMGEDELDFVDLQRKHKHPYMLWSSFLTKFHLELMQQEGELIAQGEG